MRRPADSPETLFQESRWRSRGYLPHFDGDRIPQFVTFRLFDSMPQSVIGRWRSEAATDADFRKRIEKYLDAGHGECWLRRAEIAGLVRDAIFFHVGRSIDLFAWVIMPNHVHVLLALTAEADLSGILHSIKSYSATAANRHLGRTGKFWQRESFDRYIRNAKHFGAVVNYIENNPVKAGLCRLPEEWRFSSASGAAR